MRVKKCTEANCSLRIEVLFFQALQVGHKFNTFSRVAFHNKELKNAKFPVTLAIIRVINQFGKELINNRVDKALQIVLEEGQT